MPRTATTPTSIAGLSALVDTVRTERPPVTSRGPARPSQGDRARTDQRLPSPRSDQPTERAGRNAPGSNPARSPTSPPPHHTDCDSGPTRPRWIAAPSRPKAMRPSTSPGVQSRSRNRPCHKPDAIAPPQPRRDLHTQHRPHRPKPPKPASGAQIVSRQPCHDCSRPRSLRPTRSQPDPEQPPNPTTPSRQSPAPPTRIARQTPPASFQAARFSLWRANRVVQTSPGRHRHRPSPATASGTRPCTAGGRRQAGPANHHMPPAKPGPKPAKRSPQAQIS